MVCHSASKQTTFRLREPRKTCPVASMFTAKKKVPTSNIQAGLVPLPNVKAVTARLDTWSIRHKPGGDHIKIYM
jgi:hypothetical protein